MNMKRWKPKSNKTVFNTYGKVVKVTNKHLLLVCDVVLPFFWLVATLVPKKELFSITINNR